MQTTRYLVKWAPGLMWDSRLVFVKRRWFPWPTTNVTFWNTIYEGGKKGMNDPTFRHELIHVWQYRTLGWWWVWTRRGKSEAEARAAEQANYPQWVLFVGVAP